MIKGNDLIFYFVIDGEPASFCHATDWSIKTDAELLESTTKTGASGRTYEYAKKYGYVLSISGLSVLGDDASFYTLQQKLKGFEKVNWVATDNASVVYTGVVLIQGTTLDGPLDQIATFQGDLQGDGEYTQERSDDPPTPVGYAVNIVDQFGTVIATVIAPGTYSVLRFNELYDDLLQNDDTIITDELI